MEKVIDDSTGEVLEVEVVNANEIAVLEGMERAAIDIQVATAKKYPRSITAFRSDLLAWSCEDQAIAKECTYQLPRGGKKIMGASIRYAELAQQAYGNLLVDTKILVDGSKPTDKRVIVEGTCRDVERNTASRAQVSRSILNRNGRQFEQHMIETTIAAASAIARRNAIFAIIPRALWNASWEESKRVMLGKAKTQKERIANCKAVLKELGAPLGDVEAWLGKRLTDANVDDLVAIFLRTQDVEKGTVKLSEAFPKPAPEEDKDAASERVADAISKGAKTASEKNATDHEKIHKAVSEPDGSLPLGMTDEEKAEILAAEKAEAEGQ
jgi:hypothetical protein